MYPLPCPWVRGWEIWTFDRYNQQFGGFLFYWRFWQLWPRILLIIYAFLRNHHSHIKTLISLLGHFMEKSYCFLNSNRTALCFIGWLILIVLLHRLYLDYKNISFVRGGSIWITKIFRLSDEELFQFYLLSK